MEQLTGILGASLVDLVKFLIRLIPLFMIGLFLAGIMRLSPAAGRFAVLMQPLTRLARLPDECSLVFLLTVMSRGAGLVTLSEHLEKGLVSQRQVVGIFLCSYLPAAMHHILFFAGPISLAMLGLWATLGFLLCLLVIGGIRTLAGLVYLWSGPVESATCSASLKSPQAEPTLPWPQLLLKSAGQAVRQMLKIMKVLVPSLFIALLLIKSGLMETLGLAVSPLTSAMNLPPASFVIILTGAPSTIAGVSAAGALIAANDITPYQAVLSLIIAHFFNRLYLLFRTWAPMNLAVFGAKLGGRITLAALITEFTWLPWFVIFLMVFS